MAQSDISKIENQERRLDVLEFQELLQTYRISENLKLKKLVSKFLGLDSNMQVSERNEKVKYFVDARISYAKERSEESFQTLDNYKSITNILNDLIYVKANGFRGVVLTAIAGMQFNKEFNPLTNFYGCNPRAIFEQGIWYALSENNIPCGKSDPLNVAKNINELNESWASGKRPQKAAKAAVDFLRLLVNEKNPENKLELINYFFFKLVEYAKSIEKIAVTSLEDKTISNQKIAYKLNKLVVEYPESGTIPQLVIGKLVRALFEHSSISVEGDDESVFGTNTTSKNRQIFGFR